ncbi:MAG: dephospho-CoA kinase [Planctomycetes bacterium]|nr:dephospho-CoA kinase [Planctomycetota bacterium]
MTTVLGVIGGIGSGKSAVSRAFARLGAVVLDADALAHEVLARPETRRALVEAFGAGIVDGGGALDRGALAARVFGPERTAERNRLNEIVHPAVRRELDAGLEAARREAAPLVILDVPLLLESPYREVCDRILFVKAGLEHRRRRVRARGWTDQELERRESSQSPLADKESAAQLVLVNEGDLHQLESEVKKLYDALVVG